MIAFALSDFVGAYRYGLGVKIVVQVEVLPTPEQAPALQATLDTVNVLANRVSALAYGEFGLKARERELRGLAYGELKAEGLGAQAAQHVIKRVVDAYSTLRGLINNGVLGGPQSKRRRKAESKPIVFRSDAAHTFDDRCLNWQYDSRTVSIWTVHGRLRGVTFTGSATDLKLLADHRHGESDLLLRDGQWFLVATCDIQEKPLNTEPADWLGVDRGITNLATTSDGTNYQGRRLAKRRERESRHVTHQNHTISKQIVAVAERTDRGIALEELSGIRERVRLSRDQRAMLSAWPFHQLGTFITYKALRAGVPCIEVDPAYTSQTCPRCGHAARGNRPTRDTFCCRRCGLAGPADDVAAVNIRNRARTAWAFVNMPVPEPGPQQGRCASARQPAAARSATKRERRHRASKLGRSRPRS